MFSVQLRRHSQLASLVVALLVGLPGVALAHPLIDEGVSRFDDADFTGALDSFRRAERGSDLTRDDVIQLLLRRALVNNAMGANADVEADLLRLATLEPSYALGAEIPPAVRQAFVRVQARVQSQLSLVVDATRVTGAARIVARVEGDAAGLVRAIHVAARVDRRAWSTTEDGHLELPATADSEVDYFVQAIGPGGAALVSEGLAATPRRMSARALGSSQAGTETTVHTNTTEHVTSSITESPPSSGGSSWVWWAAGGAVAVVATVAVVLIVSSGPSSDTVLGPPSANW